ncbi:MAG: flagellar basal body L-ring protein FlgH [Bacteroidota bacterium]
MPIRLIIVALLLSLGPAAAAQSLFADPKASQPGDPITIVLAERTSASSVSQFEDRSQARLSGNANVNGGSITGQFALGTNMSQDQEAESQAVQRDLLSGTITALVVSVDSTGNLQIAGERSLHVNGVTHLMRVEGTVRPLDVTYNNTVLSFQIANASVDYRQKGLRHKFFRPGTILKIGAAALVGAAIALSSQ